MSENQPVPTQTPHTEAQTGPDPKVVGEIINGVIDRLAKNSEHNTKLTVYMGLACMVCFLTIAFWLKESRQWELLSDLIKIIGSAAAGYGFGAAKKNIAG